MLRNPSTPTNTTPPRKYPVLRGLKVKVRLDLAAMTARSEYDSNVHDGAPMRALGALLQELAFAAGFHGGGVEMRQKILETFDRGDAAGLEAEVTAAALTSTKG